MLNSDKSRVIFFILFVSFCFLILLAVSCSNKEGVLAEPGEKILSDENESSACLVCHVEETPGIVASYGRGEHIKNDVGCLDCHQVHEDDPTGFEHNGFEVTVVSVHVLHVTPDMNSVLLRLKNLKHAASVIWVPIILRLRFMKNQKMEIFTVPWVRNGTGIPMSGERTIEELRPVLHAI